MYWKITNCLALSVIVSLTACGPEGAEFWDQQRLTGAGLDPRDIASVAAQDLEDIRDLPAHENASESMRLAFAGMFGGHDGSAVRRYIDERLHHYLTLEDWHAAKLHPELTSLQFGNRKEPDEPKPANPAEPGHRVRTGAFNLGMGLWLTGVANDTEFTLYAQGKTIPIDSARAGVMVIAEAYRSSDFGDDDFFDRGPLARQQVLVHEARHSDCTQGIKYETIRAIRANGTEADFFRERDPLCGHWHALCPTGPYEGAPACDAHPWGAYTAGLVFVENRLAEFDPYEVEGCLARMLAIDQRSRLLFDFNAMFQGKLGPPDMSHLSWLAP